MTAQPVIREIERVSKPGRRVYASVEASCRASPTALASPISRRPRASWPITRPASTMSAAKCSARSSDQHEPRRNTMSRIGKKPVPVPAGVTATVDGQTVKAKGPKGELSLHRSRAKSSVALEDGAVKVDPRDESKPARAKWGMSRTMVANICRGRHQGLREEARDQRRRLQGRRRRQGAEAVARLSPRRRLRDPGRHHDRRRRSRRKSSSPASTSRRSARLPPRSANIAAPSPTRARA